MRLRENARNTDMRPSGGLTGRVDAYANVRRFQFRCTTLTSWAATEKRRSPGSRSRAPEITEHPLRREDRREVPPLEKLDGQVGRCLLQARGKHLSYMGVTDSRHGAPLAEKTLGRAGQPGKTLLQDLERHRSRELRVVRGVDIGHSAPADTVRYAIRPEGPGSEPLAPPLHAPAVPCARVPAKWALRSRRATRRGLCCPDIWCSRRAKFDVSFGTRPTGPAVDLIGTGPCDPVHGASTADEGVVDGDGGGMAEERADGRRLRVA